MFKIQVQTHEKINVYFQLIVIVIPSGENFFKF